MEQRNERSGRSRKLSRQEYFLAADVAHLFVEIEELRKERDELAARSGALQPQALVPRRDMWRSLEALADRLFAVPSYDLPHGEVFERRILEVGDPRRQWLVHHFLSSFKRHRRSYDSAEWCQEAQIDVIHVSEMHVPKTSRIYRNELVEIRATRSEDRSQVPELDAAIRVRTDL